MFMALSRNVNQIVIIKERVEDASGKLGELQELQNSEQNLVNELEVKMKRKSIIDKEIKIKSEEIKEMKIKEETMKNISEKNDLFDSAKKELMELYLINLKNDEKKRASIRRTKIKINEIEICARMNSKLECAIENLEKKIKSLKKLAGGIDTTGDPLANLDVDNDPLATNTLVPTVKISVVPNLKELNHISFSNNGISFLTAGTYPFIRKWDSLNLKRLDLQSCGKSSYLFAIFSNDDQKILTSNANIGYIISNKTERIDYTLNGHTHTISSGCFSFDSRIVATSGDDRMIRLWDTERGTVLRNFSSSSKCVITISGGSENIISGHFDGTVKYYDLRQSKSLASFEYKNIHNHKITSLEFTKTGHILTSSRDNTLRIFDIQTGEVIQTFSHHNYFSGYDLNKPSISPDGSYLASGSENGEIFIWNIRDGSLHSVLTGCKSIISCVSWNPNNNDTLISVDKSGNLIIWGPET